MSWRTKLDALFCAGLNGLGLLESIQPVDPGKRYVVRVSRMMSPPELKRLGRCFRHLGITAFIFDSSISVEPLVESQRYVLNVNQIISEENAERFKRLLKDQGVDAVLLDDNAYLEPLPQASRYILYVNGLVSQETAQRLENSFQDRGLDVIVQESGAELKSRPYSFDEYHDAIGHLGNYPDVGQNMVYTALGTAGEAGEFSEKIKKFWRDMDVTGYDELADIFNSPPDDPTRLKAEKLYAGALKEMGDILWYLDASARELRTTLAEVARLNVEKLLGRVDRGTIKGSGDDR